jgi:hypothetical protein
MAFTRKFQTIVNVLTTEVSLIDPQSKRSKSFLAIWDTGASNSVVCEDLVTELGLKPSGKVMVATGNGTVERLIYIVDLQLHDNHLVERIEVTSMPKIDGHLQGLVGMDIINLGDLRITNFDNKTVMTFRIPSEMHGDFFEGNTVEG